MRRRPVIALTVLAAAWGRPARAASSLDETVGDIKELAAPAARTELRFDLGILTTIPRIGNRGVDAVTPTGSTPGTIATPPTASTRVDVRLEIAPRPDFWYGVGASSIEATTQTTTKTVSTTETTTTTTTTQSVTLSARLFKRVGPAVLSAGVVDNRGGAGLELRGLDDRLRIEALLAEWNPTDPRKIPGLRVGGSAQWSALYVQGGVLDVLDRGLASAYIGVGLRWRDADLLSTLRWFR